MSKHGHGNSNNQNNPGGGHQSEDADGYRNLKRFFALLCALVMWGLSAYFSEQGFAFKVPDLWWIGAILAVAIIVIEVVWNEEGMKHGLTLILAGMFAYTYGISTNVVGILVAQGITSLQLAAADPFTVALSTGLGVMLEIVPEAMFTWAVTGLRGKDFLSNIIPSASHSQHNRGNQQPNQNQGQPQNNQPPQGQHQP